MNTFYDPNTKQWRNGAALRLPRHDLFFGTPEHRPTAGIPIGDGDTGSLLWLEKDGVHIHVNKCDLWQDAPPGVTWDDTCYCSGHEEELTCCRHAGEITLRLNSPAFEYLYQKAFTARLSLTDAAALLDSETPFGAVHARAFAENGVTALSCEVTSAEGEAPEIRLSRWGSRNLWRWYCQQKFVPETGLDGTQSYARDDGLFITQELNATRFCIGLRLVTEETPERVYRPNGHSAAIRLENAPAHRFTLFWTVKTGDTVEQAKDACRKALDEAAEKGEAALYEAHRAAWASFWERSYLSVPDDYLENIWYLYLYYMNSESRGAYPPHFTSGLWGFYHDYIAWNYYFHYNEQHMYIPLEQAGHPELADNYFALRRNGVEKNRLYAQIVKGKKGIFLHDVTDRFGRGAEYDLLNVTPGAQAAMQMWRHWRYTGDEAFLRGTALPFMREVVCFYLDMFNKEEDGLYHIHGTTAYEGNAPTDDTLTDIVMARTLFSAYLPYAEPEQKAAMEDVLAHLPQDLVLPLENPEDWDGETFSYGIGKGQRPVGEGKVFGIGYRDGAPVRKSYGEPDCPKRGYGFPDIEFVTLYPTGETGLKDRGTPVFDVMTNQTLLHETGEQTGHWNMLPIYLARMGMGEELYKTARAMLSNYQGFPNGFNAEGGEVGTLMRDAPAFYNVTNTLNGEKHLLRSDEFVHFDFETEPIIAEALAEGLLQSHEGLLRLCPAAALPVSFRLFAEGGFAVGAELTEQGFVVTVESLRGEPCYLALPECFAGTPAFACIAPKDGGFVPTDVKKTVLGRETVYDLSALQAGETLLLTSVPMETLTPVTPPKEAPNADMKQCGRAVLGSPALMRNTD